jgi:DNA-binding NarL/FixJ family response regulator
MPEKLPAYEVSSRYERWVELWATGVRASGPPMGIGDPTTGDFIELSPSATRLLGQPVNYLDVVEPQHASADLLRLMREGLIEGARTRRRLRRTDGVLVDVEAVGWLVRSADGPDLGLGSWLPDGGSSPAENEREDVVTPAFPKQEHDRPVGDRLLLDETWRVRDIQMLGDRIVGWTPNELVNNSFLERLHPDDVPVLLFALARATSGSSASALVRLRDPDGIWYAAEVVPAIVSDDETSLVALVLGAEAEPVVGSAAPSISAIPTELRRIADHIETAAVVAPLAEVTAALGLAGADELSSRQWEIVRRLVRGERVSTIAAEMHLSRSTIRNHLTAIYAKVGVHSQEELVTRFHRGRNTDIY